MGETADQLRRQVDQKREDASDKIDQIEQQVMGKAQEIETKVTDTAQQVKAQLDWRKQVEEHPLLSVGAAMLGGMMLGGIMGKDDQHRSGYDGQANVRSAQSSGGIGEKVRQAARESGMEDSIQRFASAAFAQFGDRMREATERVFPGIADKMEPQGERRPGSSVFADSGPSAATTSTTTGTIPG